MPRYSTISFLTDYGTVDESVGVVKSVIRSINDAVGIIDITHDVPAFDVRTGSITLVRSAPYLVQGVVLAVVDPGVGTDRKGVAVEVGDGESVLIGPDNGLLAPVVQMVGGPTRVVELTNTAYQLPAPGATFAGRDIFGPAAAHISAGVDLAELGPVLDASTLVPALIPFSTVSDGIVHGDVLYVDHFGNLHTNVTPEQLEPFTGQAVVNVGSEEFGAKRALTFGSVEEGEPVLLIDDVGLVSLSLNKGSAAERFGVANGDTLTINPAC